MHRSVSLVKEGESLARQLEQGGTIIGKQPTDLLLGRAMNPRVRHMRFPVQQELVLFGQAAELAPLESVVLDVLHTALHLSLVTRRVEPGGKNSGSVMGRERLEPGKHHRVVPIGLRY